MVVTAGLTVTLAPVKDPGIQVYETAPDADNVAELPAQITVGDTLAVTVGVGFTVKDKVRVFVQVPFDPVTEYTVVTVGETVMFDPVNPPGIQV